MTIRNRMETELVNCGLWPDEAKIVMDKLESESHSPMKYRYNEDETAYPVRLLAVILRTVKNKAIEWIDANAPKHFARGLLKD